VKIEDQKLSIKTQFKGVQTRFQCISRTELLSDLVEMAVERDLNGGVQVLKVQAPKRISHKGGLTRFKQG
jgi:DNA-binding transcriptional regulator YbjK